MSYFKKNINIYILFSSIIIINSSNEINTSQKFCSIDEYCSDCTFCGNDTNDYTPCSYYNIFCTQKFTNYTVLQESFLKKYSTFFRNITNANEFCGKEAYTLDSLIDPFSIIYKSNKDIENSNINHCNYEINNTKYFYNFEDDANLIIKYKTNNPENNNLKSIFNILLQNLRFGSSKLITMDEQDLIKEEDYKINLNNYNIITILIDFYLDEEINTNIDEYLEIRIETNNKSIKSKKLRIIIISVIFGVIFLSIIIVIIFKCRKRKLTLYLSRSQSGLFRQDELKRIQKVEKLNKLFENTLIPKEFNENDVTNDCTECAICIEKFVDKCLICVTPCKHIFHYECLSKYIDTAKIKQKPVIKCPLCNYDFLEEEKDNKKLNEINNVNNEINNNQINNNETNNNENNNNENNEQNNSPPVGARVINENCVDPNITSKEELNNKI